MKIIRFSLEMDSVGRGISDDGWEEIEPKILECWKNAQAIYDKSLWIYDGVEYELRVDFYDAIEDVKIFIEKMEIFKINYDYNIFDELNSRKNYCKFSLNCPDDVKDGTPSNIVEYISYEIFIAMNIAEPGSCNFRSSTLFRNPPERGYKGRLYGNDINLSNHMFESATYEKIFIKSKINSMNLIDVVAWIRKICPPYMMVATTPAARAVFALKHIAKMEPSPAMVVWIFYALESFFQCKVGENFNSTVRRISKLLNLNSEESKKISKSLRKIYDLRSAFVHGGHSYTSK